MNKNSPLFRRDFIESTVIEGDIGVYLLSFCTFPQINKKGNLKLPTSLYKFPNWKAIMAGLVGCGCYVISATVNFLDIEQNLQIVALGNVFQDRFESLREILRKGRNVEIPDDNCLICFDSYENVI